MFRRGRHFSGLPRRRFNWGGMGALFNPKGQLAAQARQALDEANKLLDSQKFTEAGEAFAELAELATEHQRPRRAAQMHYRAFDSFLKAANGSTALEQAKQVWVVIGELGKPGKAVQVAQHLIAELKEAHLTKEADELTREVNAQLSQRGLALATAPQPTPAAEQKPRANNCAKCGARLYWLTDDEVECEYCGTMTYL